MKRRRLFLAPLVIVLCMAAAAAADTGAAGRITKEEAKALLGAPDTVFLDARTGGSWSGSSEKIRGAVRVDPRDVASWAGKFQKDARLIVYCS
jgi:rhodanese-related sulfurtransferase